MKLRRIMMVLAALGLTMKLSADPGTDPEPALSPIMLTSAGVTTTKCVLKSSEGISNFADAEAKREADSPDNQTVQYPESQWGSPVRKAVAGYIANSSGDYNADAVYPDPDVGYAGGRWEQSGNAIFKFQGDIVVPAAGDWSFAVGAAERSLLSVAIGDGGDFAFAESFNADPGVAHRILHVTFPSAGTYRLSVGQFRADGGAYLEVSAAPGAVGEFSKDAFTLVMTESHRVTFDSAGGSEVAPLVVLDGSPATEPEPPVREGFAFVCWLLADEPYDFSAPVTEDLALTASWSDNRPPVVESVSANPTEVELSGGSAAVRLTVVASDPDGNPLTYAWTAVGEQPSIYEFAAPDAAETDVTMLGPGTYVFEVTVSDGFARVTGEPVSVTVTSPADAMRVTFAGYECSQGAVGYEGGLENPSIDKYPWGACDNGYKVAWRSTDAGNPANGGRKNLLLDAKRPNAYGLDGYLFFHSDAAEEVVTGTVTEDGKSVNGVTEYVSSFTLADGANRAGTTIFYMDDPRQEVGPDVRDFKPGELTVTSKEVAPIGTIRFGAKVARHPVVRIGFLSAYGDSYKPYKIYVGGTSREWVGRVTGYGNLGWMFFDVENAKPGDELTVYVDTTGNHWDTARIEGIVFDSVETKTKGVTVIFY